MRKLGLAVITLFFLLPVIVHPDFLFSRGNDLEEFFMPLISYSKKEILINKNLPLWNKHILSGTPLAPDPQAPIFYPPNILHLFLPIKISTLILIFIHLLLGVIFIDKIASIFKLPKIAALFASTAFILSPRLASYIEAGHLSLIYSWGLIPPLFYFVIRLSQKSKPKDCIFFALFIAAIFLNHTVTWAIALLSAAITFIYLLINQKQKTKKTLNFIAGNLLGLGLIACALLPQLAWQPQTTRSFLLNNPEIHPPWHSIFEFIKASINSLLVSKNAIRQLDTEAYISLGGTSLILALLGFLKLKKTLKISVFVLAILITLFASGNASPIYTFLIKLDYFILLRVPTRVFFIPVLVTIFLAAFALKKYKNKAVKALSILAIIELAVLSWGRITKPVQSLQNKAPEAVYIFLQKNTRNERVFCTTRCLSQNKAVEYGLETIEGYSTLQQKNYFKRAPVLMNTFWHEKYSLSVPPFWILYSEKLNPHAIYLAECSVKYIVSPHQLTDKSLKLIKEIEKFKIYENLLVKPRAYFENGDSPQKITIKPNSLYYEFDKTQEGSLILSEVFSPGWIAYLDGKRVNISETPEALREIYIPKGSKFLKLTYIPKGLINGLIISALSAVFAVITLKKQKIKLHPPDAKALMYFALFTAVFLPRLYNLKETTINPDEIMWASRARESVYAYKNNFSYFKTAWWNEKSFSESIGLPMVWLTGPSVIFLTQGIGKFSIDLFPEIVAARLPVAIANACFLIIFFFTIKKLLNYKTALISTILLSLDPVYTESSRILQQDALLTGFTFISIVAYLFIKNISFSALIASASLALGFLTKPTALFVILSFFYHTHRSNLKKLFITAALTTLIIIFLWPQSLFNPIFSIPEYLLRQINIANKGAPNFFFGKVSNSPSYLYYLFQLLSRLPAPIVLLLLLSIAHIKKAGRKTFSIIILNAAYLVAMSLMGKKLGARYILPLWPWIYLAATYSLLNQKINKKLLNLLIVFVIIYQATIAVKFFPNYFTFYNIFTGGTKKAQKYDLIGLCYGGREAAEYIEKCMPQIKSVAFLGCSKTALPYYSSLKITTDWEKEKVIILENSFKTLLPNEPIISEVEKKPLIHAINIKGATISWIYQKNSITENFCR